MRLNSRRNLLKKTGILGIGLLVGNKFPIPENEFSIKTLACADTPQQTEGPFYPLEFPSDQNNDLTLVAGHNQSAKGEKIIITGRILTTMCQPIAGAKVEIWQACFSGRYNHDYDGNSAALDPNFQYWGYATTGVDGKYSFTTVKPGSYAVTDTWKRPPHIHFKITANQFPQLITQLYFAEEIGLNEKDHILQRVPLQQRNLVITELTPDESLKMRVGQFDIVLSQGTQPRTTPKIQG